MIPIGMSDVIEILKKISQAAEKFKSKEVNEAIIELQSKVMSIQQEIIKLNAENEDLKQKLEKKDKYNMIFEKNVCWNLKSDGTKEGPFCSACWDNNGKAIRMGSGQNAFGKPIYKCMVCNTIIGR
jgi:hypothetical protein